MAEVLEYPEADGQFRLLPCCACSGKAGYRSSNTGGRAQWQVKCSGCGQRTPLYPCRHDAQSDWNGRFSARMK